MKTYDEVKARYEELCEQYEEALEFDVFYPNESFRSVMLKAKMDQCGELLKRRSYSPWFGSDR